MTELTAIKGVGVALQKKCQQAGIHSIEELIAYVPRAYSDYSQVTPIAECMPGQITILATLTSIVGRYVRRGMHITEAIVSDKSGSLKVVWFNQPYRSTSMKTGELYYFAGNFGLSRQRMTLTSPVTERASELPIHTARIVPIYREVKGLTSVQIRKMVAAVFAVAKPVPETLPDWLLTQYKLLDRHIALKEMHFPSSADSLQIAKHRLGFEEVFYLTLASLMNKREFAQEKSLKVPFNESLAKKFVSNLPFVLTDDQRKVVWNIYKDMQQTRPMNRLVEGDVGSGKTVVAAMAAVMALQAGFQVAFMAPTELLARQHAKTLYDVLLSVSMQNKISLLIGSMTKKQKETVHEHIKTNTGALIVGTHALFSDKVVMNNLGLVIIDEQHRFGVEQRKKLQSKAGVVPHILSMTATPIPRSLALTLYGELDISVIANKPSGRLPTKTIMVSPNSRQGMYKHAYQQLDAGRQVFVVCPSIAGEEKTGPSVERVFAEAQQKHFKNWRVAMLHGKMKPEEKDSIMAQYVAHNIDVLVSTTVIEVGVDVPNATVMVVEGAERFGLAQIHQLRGRVGRSEHQGFCYLVPSSSKDPSPRLRALVTTHDGFALSELDLELRGPGAIYGTLQSGALDLRVAKLSDTKLIAEARAAAEQFLERHENLIHYPVVYRHVQKIRTITNLD